jgi:hypothetical protein
MERTPAQRAAAAKWEVKSRWVNRDYIARKLQNAPSDQSRASLLKKMSEAEEDLRTSYDYWREAQKAQEEA